VGILKKEKEKKERKKERKKEKTPIASIEKYN